MRGLRSRPASPLRSQLAIEQLEDRAQPAALLLLGDTAFVVPGLHLALGHSPPSATVEISLPATANQHAVFEITLHFGAPTTPGDPPSTPGSDPSTPPIGTPPTVIPPTVTPTTGGNGSASSPASSGNGLSSLFLAREAAAQASFLTALAAARSSAALLPPGAGSSSAAIAPSANPADSRTAGGSQQSPSAFPATGPVIYNYFVEPTAPRVTQFSLTPTPFADANPKVASAAVPVQATSPQRVVNVPVQDIPALVMPPIVVDADAAVPVAEVAVPEVLTASPEAAFPSWTWTAVGLAGVAGASWAAHRYWLKSKPAAARRPSDWRGYLLGLDFDNA